MGQGWENLGKLHTIKFDLTMKAMLVILENPGF